MLLGCHLTETACVDANRQQSLALSNLLLGFSYAVKNTELFLVMLCMHKKDSKAFEFHDIFYTN